MLLVAKHLDLLLGLQVVKKTGGSSTEEKKKSTSTKVRPYETTYYDLLAAYAYYSSLPGILKRKCDYYLLAALGIRILD